MDVMTLGDICKLLKITEQTARNRLSLGLPMPPSFKIGRRRLFMVSEVKTWLCRQAGIEMSDSTSKQNNNLHAKRGRPHKTSSVGRTS